MKPAVRIGVIVAAFFVVAMLVWQGLNAHGAPDPMRANTSPTVAFLDIGILVFREGLECILVLAAITASMTGAKSAHRKPVAVGAGVAFGATLITWFIAVRIVDSLSDNMRALDLQAATGLLAVVVLLVIMNWFFHKIYWGGWIRAHNRRRKSLLTKVRARGSGRSRLWWGLVLLVMVGEQAQEMQLAHWISRTEISWLVNALPPWLGMWFAVFPTYETLL